MGAEGERQDTNQQVVVAPVWAEPYWPGATPNLGLREHRLSRLGQVTSTF